jgi:hypothetical protein
MAQDQAGQGRHDPYGELSRLRRDHPQYEIGLMGSEIWEAVSHPAPGQTVVHCADSIDKLRAKIEVDAS